MADTAAATRQTLAEDLRYGQAVYDFDGHRIGTIGDLDTERGWLRIAASPLPAETFYIPFRLITRIDAEGQAVSLSLPLKELWADYNQPPARQVQVEKTQDETVASTIEPSGYDGAPVVVHRVNLADIKGKIEQGDDVESSENVSLGTIKRYDPTTGWMLVRQPGRVRDLLVPVTAVERVDAAHHVVSLALGEVDLRRLRHGEPVDVVFVDRTPLTAADA